jgi:hypothetical protein
MQKQKKSKAAKQAANTPWGQIRLGSFKAEFPQPRIPRLLGSASSLGQGGSVYPHVKLDVPITPQAAVLVAGAAAVAVPLDLTIINLFATRFGGLFREYAIVGANLEVRPNNTINGAGFANVYIDEATGAAPTANEALDRPRLDVLFTQQFTKGAYMLQWSPRDLLDLDYTATGTTFTPAWLKVFASVAGTLTTATTTGQILITGSLAFDFRGYL